MRGRKIRFDAAEGLRPTLDRIRETLFNWLARDIGNSNCLDLFAGSGALGFEAASRGASNVTLVEQNAKVAKSLEQNCQLLKVNNVTVANQSAELFLTQTTEKFDLVFLDPPFAKNLLPATLIKLSPCLAENALLYIEQEHSPNIFIPGEPWQQLKLKSSGSFSYGLYRLSHEPTP